jgi:surface antigen
VLSWKIPKLKGFKRLYCRKLPILKTKTILFRWLSFKKENIEKTIELLLKKPYLRAGAVIFIVSIFMFFISAIAGGSENIFIEDESEAVRKGSFVYAAQYLNPEEFIIEEAYADGELAENLSIVLQDGSVVAACSPSTLSSAMGEQRSGVIAYEVQSGDVISEIAAAFGISTNTLLWANNLSVWDYIKPGQKLNILPVSGILHTVKKGETLDKIVKTYKGDLDKTVSFNGLPASGNLAIGQQIIIPDGEKVSSYQPRTYATTTYNDFPRPYANESHRFPWGQCTWYVAQRRYIPWSGNAKTWIYKAPQYGFATGTDPKVGAIVQTRESSLYGHVAYVENVEGDYITISEMHMGQGIKKVRVLNKDDWRIIGYIY